jgi:hypothetical protein
MSRWQAACGLAAILALGTAAARAGDGFGEGSDEEQSDQFWPVNPDEAASFWFAEFCRRMGADKTAVIAYWAHTVYLGSPWYHLASQRYRHFESWRSLAKPSDPLAEAPPPGLNGPLVLESGEFSFDKTYPNEEFVYEEAEFTAQRILVHMSRTPTRTRYASHARNSLMSNGLNFTLEDLAVTVPIICLSGISPDPEDTPTVFSFILGPSR